MSKFGLCAAGCGAKVQVTTNPKVHCQPCRLRRKRERARLVMARVRVSRGVSPIKGTEIACKRCGDRFTRKGVAAKFCEPCKPLAILERSAKRSKQFFATDEGKTYYRNYERSRAARDPSYRLRRSMRTYLAKCLEAGKAGRKWECLVGYTLADLMRHLERQFLPGMTWENRGEWHIDHIRPLCSFEFQTPDCPQFGEAWALTNLRPIWARDNLKKSGSRTLLL